MNDDLISREALTEEMRKSINERYPKWDKPITVADIATLIFDVIDNTPTVDIPKHSLLPLEGDCDEAYMRGYEHGKAEAILRGRPQGEWVKYLYYAHDNSWKYVCSECRELNCQEDNFCPNCGADMRTKEVKE